MQPPLERELESLRISSPEALDANNQSHYEQLLPNNETVTWYITESFPETFEGYAPGMHIFLSPPDKAYDISEADKKDIYSSKTRGVLTAVYKTESSEKVARLTTRTAHNAWFHNSIVVYGSLAWGRIPIGLPSTPTDLSADACALDELDLAPLDASTTRRMRFRYPFPYSTGESHYRKPYLGLYFTAPHTLVLQLAPESNTPIQTIELFKEDD